MLDWLDWLTEIVMWFKTKGFSRSKATVAENKAPNRHDRQRQTTTTGRQTTTVKWRLNDDKWGIIYALNCLIFTPNSMCAYTSSSRAVTQSDTATDLYSNMHLLRHTQWQTVSHLVSALKCLISTTHQHTAQTSFALPNSASSLC